MKRYSLNPTRNAEVFLHRHEMIYPMQIELFICFNFPDER